MALDRPGGKDLDAPIRDVARLQGVKDLVLSAHWRHGAPPTSLCTHSCVNMCEECPSYLVGVAGRDRASHWLCFSESTPTNLDGGPECKRHAHPTE